MYKREPRREGETRGGAERGEEGMVVERMRAYHCNSFRGQPALKIDMVHGWQKKVDGPLSSSMYDR